MILKLGIPKGSLQDATVQLFSVRESPLSRQLALGLARSIAPDRVLVPHGSGLERMGWPVGAEEVELPDSFPPVVHEAQRRARWMEVAESCEDLALTFLCCPIIPKDLQDTPLVSLA